MIFITFYFFKDLLKLCTLFRRMKNVIIGAGISGLYLAYKLIKVENVNPDDIVIYEKLNRIGGRVHTYNNKGFKYSVGAGRLGKKHKYVMALIRDLNLTDEIIDIGKDNVYYVNGMYMTEKELLKYHKSSYKSINELWEYAINKKMNIDKNKYNLHNYFSLFLPSNEVELLKISFGYIAEFYDMNSKNAMVTIKKDFDILDKSFFVLKNGIQILCDKLYEYLLLKKVKIIFNASLMDINDDNKTYIINKETYRYSKLYLTITKCDYLAMPYFNKYKNILNNVNEGKLLRIYAKYKDVWFKGMPKILTDNKLQFIIPIDYDNGLIQISYSDSYNTDFWNSFNDKKTIKKHITRILNDMFPEKNIKEPEWISLHYWSSGDHLWKVGINSKDIIKQIDDIFIKKDIYILGETYSERQSWIEGALETIHKKVLI